MTTEEAIKILELHGEEITPDKIRKSFIRLSKIYHPDASGKKDDSMFKKINEAYIFLRNNPVYKNGMSDLSEAELKIMLDNLILEIVEEFDKEIYLNIVVPELKEWFKSNEPLMELQHTIENKIEYIKPRLTQMVKSKFDKFSSDIGAKLDSSFYHVSNSFDAKYLSVLVGGMITEVIGLVSAGVMAMISGGSGMALIATGPLGLIIGGGLGYFLFKKNKNEIKRKVENYVLYNGLPKMVKDYIAQSVIDKVVNGEEKFVKEITEKLREDLAPIYKQIKLITY